jgi:hypothetical protein
MGDAADERDFIVDISKDDISQNSADQFCYHCGAPCKPCDEKCHACDQELDSTPDPATPEPTIIDNVTALGKPVSAMLLTFPLMLIALGIIGVIAISIVGLLKLFR